MELALLPLPRNINSFFRADLLPPEWDIKLLRRGGRVKGVKVSEIGKNFEFDLSQVTDSQISKIISTNLKANTDKDYIIEETISVARYVTELLINEETDIRAKWGCLNYLAFFILEYECAIINYLVDHKEKNTNLFRLFNVSSKYNIIQLFKAFIIVSKKGTCDAFRNDWADLWFCYADLLLSEEKDNRIRIKEEKLQKLHRELGETLEIQPSESIYKPQKIKLPCYNYLFAALLHEKARRTGDDFVRLCREAADRFIDRNGKEFTGEQLANVFHITVKKYGGWPGFYENNKEKIKKLKKEINWQE